MNARIFCDINLLTVQTLLYIMEMCLYFLIHYRRGQTYQSFSNFFLRFTDSGEVFLGCESTAHNILELLIFLVIRKYLTFRRMIYFNGRPTVDQSC